MADYRVVTRENITARGNQSRRLVVVLDGVKTKPDAVRQLKRVAREYRKSLDFLIAYAYLEEEAIAWGGYIARMIVRKGQQPAMYFDNDPIARHAQYLADSEV